MRLAVPVLVNYEGLIRLIESAERGVLRPEDYLVIDNGGGLEKIFLDPRLREVVEKSRLWGVTPTANLGVAASWNIALDRLKEPLIIANDDVVLGKNQFAEMTRALETHPFVGNGWCLFGQTPECTERVGFYDENFFPACYEDSDYAVRLHRAGVERFWDPLWTVEHAGCWTTANMLGNPVWFQDGLERCRQYFIRKWGAMPSDTFDGYYEEPFNGKVPYGWSLRR